MHRLDLHLSTPTRARTDAWRAARLVMRSMVAFVLGAFVLGGHHAAAQGGTATRAATGFQTRAANGSTVVFARSVPPAAGLPLGMVPANGTTWYLRTVVVGSTGLAEQFMLFVPDGTAGQPRPLLTCFHGANTSQLDVLFNTSYLFEAGRRDWYLLAPLQRAAVGSSQGSWASVESQQHVEAVLDFVLQEPSFSVDADRLYAVGFSMGGGNALSYTARHRDPGEPTFAAVVNHTGSASLAHVWSNAPAVRPQMELLFGGTPTQQPFAYQRSSLVEIGANGAFVPGGRHMARNLIGVPVRTYYNPSDPNGYLVQQCSALHAFLGTLPGTLHELVPVPAGPHCASGHCWNTVEEDEVCDWLASKTRPADPLVGTYLIDRTRPRWGAFTVDATVGNTFTRFDYVADPIANTLVVNGTSNVLRVALVLTELSLDPGRPLDIRTGSVDFSGDRIAIRGLAGPPSSVQRNGLSVAPLPCGTPSPSTASWCYTGGELEINEIGSGGATWTIWP